MAITSFTKVSLFLLCNAIFTLPMFTYASETTLERLEHHINQHKGKVIYLDFWSSWCGPCRKSFPWMNKLQQKYQEQGLTILSVNLDHDRKLADKFLLDSPADFPIIYDSKGLIARKYKLKGMPSSFIYDRTGKLVNAHVGFNKQKSQLYEQELAQLLNAKSQLEKP